jgi:hypothetical protein
MARSAGSLRGCELVVLTREQAERVADDYCLSRVTEEQQVIMLWHHFGVSRCYQDPHGGVESAPPLWHRTVPDE